MALYPINFGKARFRGGGWRGSADIAYLVPISAASTLDRRSLEAARAKLTADGFSEVITGAVGISECRVMRDDGFVDREHLHLLRHDLEGTIARRDSMSRRIKKGRLTHRKSILALDSVAFDGFWSLDQSGFQEALDATPVSRLRVISDGPVVAYSITGRAGRNGYLQRLAVAPGAQGEGLGSALVHDALRWLKRRRAEHVWVNTQETNERAYQLYLRLGFRPEPTQLTVLQRQLP